MKKIALFLIVCLLAMNCAFAEEGNTQTMTLKLIVPDRVISIYTGEHIGVQVGEEVLKESEEGPAQVNAPRLEDIEIQLVPDEGWEVYQVTFDAGEASVGSFDAEAAKLTFTEIPADETVRIIERQLVTDWKWQDNEDETTCTILKYLGTETEVTVPEKIYDRTVNTLSSGTFAGFETITKVTIPYSVTTIEDDCFDAQAQLTIACHEDSAAHTFALAKEMPFELENHTGTPAGCTTTGHCDICGKDLTPTGHDIAFEKSIYETSVNEPITIAIQQACEDEIGKVTWTGATDGNFVSDKAGWFTVTAKTEDEYTEALTCNVIVHSKEVLELPAALQEIGEEAFKDNAQIVEVVLPQNCTTICNKAFASCTGLKLIALPSALTTIEEDAFEGCAEDVLFICSTQAQVEYAQAKGFNFVLKSDD